MALSVVTFNIGGGDGTRYEKKAMIDHFLNDHLPSFLYFQENPWRKRFIKNHVPKIKERYEAVLHEHFHATVLYRKDVLKDEGSAELRELFRDAFNHKFYLDFVTFKERASFSKLTEIKTGRSFVAISWHGEYIGLTDQVKRNKFEDLLLVIKDINTKTKLPVVLGGDFNITLDSVSDSIEEQGLEVYEYEPQNRKTVIDFFVVTNDVRLSDVRAFGDYMYINVKLKLRQQVSDNSLSEFLGSNKQKYVIGREVVKKKQIFDHDPVQAIVSFDLDKEIENQARESNGKYTADDELDGLAYYFKNFLYKL